MPSFLCLRDSQGTKRVCYVSCLSAEAVLKDREKHRHLESLVIHFPPSVLQHFTALHNSMVVWSTVEPGDGGTWSLSLPVRSRAFKISALPTGSVTPTSVLFGLSAQTSSSCFQKCMLSGSFWKAVIFSALCVIVNASVES